MAENVSYEGTKPQKTALMKFAMADNVCYQGTNPLPKDSFGKHEAKGLSSKKMILILFALVMALLLGTVCACVVFALEISILKSEMASLQTSTQQSYFENLTEQISMISRQQSYVLETTENLTQKINIVSHQLVSLHQQIDHLTPLTNTTQLLNMSIQDLYSAIQPTSCSALPPSSPTGSESTNNQN